MPAPVITRAALTPQWVRNELWRRARATPSLDLRFAESKSLGDAVSGRSLVTFTRASSATYVDSDGLIKTASNDVPRLQHDPTTGACLGLLVEEQRQNLLTRSEEFDNASWTLAGILGFGSGSTANALASPSGSVTADFVVENTAAALHRVTSAAISVTAGTAYSVSVYAKSSDRNLYINADGLLAARANFNLSTGAVTVGVGTASMQSLPNGWYRCTVTGTAPSTTSGGFFFQINSNTSAADNSYTGNGTSGLYLWGAQLEAGAFPTSYIPTTGTSATRSADIATITTLGSSIRSLFAQVRGPASGTRGIIGLDDNSANNRIELLTSGTDPKLLVTTGGSAVADLDGGTLAANVEVRLAARFAADNYAISVGGGAEVVDTAGALPAVDRIRIGALQAGNTFSGTIARLTAWDQVPAMLRSVSG